MYAAKSCFAPLELTPRFFENLAALHEMLDLTSSNHFPKEQVKQKYVFPTFQTFIFCLFTKVSLSSGSAVTFTWEKADIRTDFQLYFCDYITRDVNTEQINFKTLYQWSLIWANQTLKIDLIYKERKTDTSVWTIRLLFIL